MVAQSMTLHAHSTYLLFEVFPTCQAQGGMGYLVQLLRNAALYPIAGVKFDSVSARLQAFNMVNVFGGDGPGAFRFGADFENLRSEAWDLLNWLLSAAMPKIHRHSWVHALGWERSAAPPADKT